MSTPVWQRWTLLIALFVLGVGYVLAFALFNRDSMDFIVDQQNRRAMQYARAAPIGIPNTLQFNAGAIGATLLGGGWYASEAGGAWSSRNDSWIALALRDTNDGVKVTLNGNAFVTARHHKKIVVSADVGAQRLGAWQRTISNPAEPIQLCMPAAIARRGSFLLHLHVDRLSSPLETDEGPDHRTLGWFLASMELQRGCE
jgi:hypothetical protein